ncbi:hypothetical protein [Serratia sp. N21D137]|uniref:hypothetical protein n=1 Tax=Serratia sp. N21D137 TaxID=3397495 RepID=UPI0039E07298
MTVFEMEGVLRGKAIPADMKVNESLAAYLVRKLADAEARGVEKLADAWASIAARDDGVTKSESLILKYQQRADDARAFAYELREGRA